jgi:hypothetical protein
MAIGTMGTLRGSELEPNSHRSHRAVIIVVIASLPPIPVTNFVSRLSASVTRVFRAE